MKQLIVLVSTVVLGIAIAGMIMGFKGTAKTITDNSNSAILSLFTTSD